MIVACQSNFTNANTDIMQNATQTSLKMLKESHSSEAHTNPPGLAVTTETNTAVEPGRMNRPLRCSCHFLRWNSAGWYPLVSVSSPSGVSVTCTPASACSGTAVSSVSASTTQPDRTAAAAKRHSGPNPGDLVLIYLHLTDHQTPVGIPARNDIPYSTTNSCITAKYIVLKGSFI